MLLRVGGEPACGASVQSRRIGAEQGDKHERGHENRPLRASSSRMLCAPRFQVAYALSIMSQCVTTSILCTACLRLRSFDLNVLRSGERAVASSSAPGPNSPPGVRDTVKHRSLYAHFAQLPHRSLEVRGASTGTNLESPGSRFLRAARPLLGIPY